MKILSLCWISLLWVSATSTILTEEEINSKFAEKLTLTPLPNGHLHTNFNFDITSGDFSPLENKATIISNFNIFPNSLINLLSQTNTHNLSIRFTSGFWNSENWGKLPNEGFTSGGKGVELSATIEANSTEEAFKHWRFLANSLSGFFCASLNFIDESITTFPNYSFKEGLIQNNNKNIYLLRASLPTEPLCTENLTPIIKLLPTKGRAGISSILDGHKLFDSSWVSTSIDINTFKNLDSTYYHKLSIDLNNVFNVPMSISKIKRPLPKPIPGEELNCDYDKFYDSYHCFPSNEYYEGLRFNFDTIFGRKIKIDSKFGTSKVCANLNRTANNEDTPDNEKQIWKLQGGLSSQVKETGHVLFAYTDIGDDDCYELTNNPKKKEEFNLEFILQSSYNNIRISDENKPKIYVSRSITGYELDKGGLRVVFKNPGNENIKLVYFESLPWYLRLYLSSMKITEKSSSSLIPTQDIIKNISYITAIDRQRPAKLEMILEIPANSTITLSYSFDKSLLLYSEYPPDANHGFELESAVISLINDDFSTYYTFRTSTLLVSLPTPDFSMPYNVIILTSTIMALIFGTVCNLLIKRIISEEDHEKLLTDLPKKNLKYYIESIKNKFVLKIKKD